MRRTRFILAAGALAAALGVSARLSLHAQERPQPGESKGASGGTEARARSGDRAGGVAASVMDALERPFALPFGEPTSLEAVCRHLRRALGAPVVLDLAALDRQDVRPDDKVELELDGVRLKTGLKLLLDQVGLTYRVVAEDNLLVLTDSEGADDPVNRVLAEVKELHRDIHDVQDALDEVRAALGLDGDGPRVRKPTIIEEMPGDPAAPKAPASSPTPRPRPGA